MRSAWAAIVSMGRSPRRMTQETPTATSRPATAEPMMRMSSSRPTVLLTAARLVVATRAPAAVGTGLTRRRSWVVPPTLVTVWTCGPAAETGQPGGSCGTRPGLPTMNPRRP